METDFPGLGSRGVFSPREDLLQGSPRTLEVQNRSRFHPNSREYFSVRYFTPAQASGPVFFLNFIANSLGIFVFTKYLSVCYFMSARVPDSIFRRNI